MNPPILAALLVFAGTLWLLIKAAGLAAEIDLRSHPELYRPDAPDRRVNILVVAINWRIARDTETQKLRRRMNLMLLAALLAAAVAGLLISHGVSQ